MSKEKRPVEEPASGPFRAGSADGDAIKNFQEMTRQSWEALMAHLQQPLDGARAGDTARSSSTRTPPGNVTIDHALAGLKSYADWMQGAAASVSTPQADWRQQMQQLFGGASQPFSHGFGGTDSANAKVFADQWLTWLQSMQKNGISGAPPQAPFSSGFGFANEQQTQQQDLAAAISQHLEATQRYQLLMQRSNAQAMDKMQARLVQLAKPGQPIESLKDLYDLWVDCAEEAYAEIALSDEFRERYSEMVNTQIRVRQLQQEQTEYLCQQLGIPTRSDLSSLGERLQAMRREMRSGKPAASADCAPDAHAGELAALKREVAELRELLLASKASRPTSRGKAPGKVTAKPARSAVKKAVNKPMPAKKKKIAAGKSATVSVSRTRLVARPATRKHK